MKQLYSAKNGLEAHDLRLFLESHGITAKVLGDNNALEGILSFSPGSVAGVFVGEHDLVRAGQLLNEYVNQPATPGGEGQWTCTNCGQSIAASFDACWSCEALRDETSNKASSGPAKAEESEPTETGAVDDLASDKDPATAHAEGGVASGPSHNVWFAVLAVLAIAWFPYIAACGLDLYSYDPADWTYLVEQIWGIVDDLSIIAVVLYIIYRDGRPWSTFGISRPQWARDIGWAVLVYFAAVVAMDVVYSLGVMAVGPREMERLSTSSYEFAKPVFVADYVALVLVSLSIGLSEELAMRGYLLPTLERLLGSTTKSILVTSLLFASYHLYQGAGAAVWIFLGGLVFGCAFCWIRRLWPLVLAHAAMDIVASWPAESL